MWAISLLSFHFFLSLLLCRQPIISTDNSAPGSPSAQRTDWRMCFLLKHSQSGSLSAVGCGGNDMTLFWQLCEGDERERFRVIGSGDRKAQTSGIIFLKSLRNAIGALVMPNGRRQTQADGPFTKKSLYTPLCITFTNNIIKWEQKNWKI